MKALNENERISLYMDLANAFVTEDAAGEWIIDTPWDRLYYGTKADMMRDIDENLEIMEEAYRTNGEISYWLKAVELAKELTNLSQVC